MSEPVIDNVRAPGGGRIGIVHCPGSTAVGHPGTASTTLDEDLATLVAWGADALVTMLQPYEMILIGVEDLGQRARALGLDWWYLPVTDGAAPGTAFESTWLEAGPALHARLDDDGRIVIHCRAGIGRSGSLAARLLIERGMRPRDAIVAVRRARPGAIESPEQHRWVQACRPR